MTRSASLFIGLCLTAVILTGARLPAQTTRGTASPSQPPVTQSSPVPVIGLEVDARETRDQLQQVLQRYPPDLGRILKMDPTMLRDQDYLAKYPALVSFLSAHPEVVHNPSYYLEFVHLSSDYTRPVDARSRAVDLFRNTLEAVSVFVVMVFVAGTLAWLVKTALDHRRWLRVSRVQTEVHNKLLDRFASTGEMLAYVQSPAGRRFLEAAPIGLDPSSRGVQAPLGRILWSVQAGVVLLVGGIGFQFVSGNVVEEVAAGLSMIGVLAIAFGIGFILSGLVSYVLSRRLGLVEPTRPLGVTDRGDTTAV
jgi:hypothetical protein